jgi:hypothetical protein
VSFDAIEDDGGGGPGSNQLLCFTKKTGSVIFVGISSARGKMIGTRLLHFTEKKSKCQRSDKKSDATIFIATLLRLGPSFRHHRPDLLLYHHHNLHRNL